MHFSQNNFTHLNIVYLHNVIVDIIQGNVKEKMKDEVIIIKGVYLVVFNFPLLNTSLTKARVICVLVLSCPFAVELHVFFFTNDKMIIVSIK